MEYLRHSGDPCHRRPGGCPVDIGLAPSRSRKGLGHVHTHAFTTRRPHRRSRSHRRRLHGVLGRTRRGGRPRQPLHPADDPRHDRSPRERLQLGLLQERRVRRRRPQRHRHRQGADPDQGAARADRQRPAARPRRRRHHPGNAARLLLRQDRADHLRRHAPDGQRHEPDRVRRGSARQPRVQLRHPAAPYLRAAADLPVARGQRGRPRHRPAGVHAVHRQEVPDAAGSGPQGRHPRAHQPGHRHLGPRQRRRGRSTSRVWSSRRRSSCRS